MFIEKLFVLQICLIVFLVTFISLLTVVVGRHIDSRYAGITLYDLTFPTCLLSHGFPRNKETTKIDTNRDEPWIEHNETRCREHTKDFHWRVTPKYLGRIRLNGTSRLEKVPHLITSSTPVVSLTITLGGLGRFRL